MLPTVHGIIYPWAWLGQNAGHWDICLIWTLFAVGASVFHKPIFFSKFILNCAWKCVIIFVILPTYHKSNFLDWNQTLGYMEHIHIILAMIFHLFCCTLMLSYNQMNVNKLLLYTDFVLIYLPSFLISETWWFFSLWIWNRLQLLSNHSYFTQKLLMRSHYSFVEQHLYVAFHYYTPRNKIRGDILESTWPSVHARLGWMFQSHTCNYTHHHATLHARLAMSRGCDLLIFGLQNQGQNA